MTNPTKASQLRFSLLLLFILIVAGLRTLLSLDPAFAPVANLSAVGAMALFGGAYLRSWKAFVFPLLALLLSDLLISRFAYWGGSWTLFYQGAGFVYGAITLMVLVGYFLLQQKTMGRFLLSSLAIVFIHWIVTDLGVWLGSSIYPATASGFWACLVAAIPFERNFLLGTLLYGGVMFGAFEWMKQRFPQVCLRSAEQ